jgi:hypothetical protein
MAVVSAQEQRGPEERVGRTAHELKELFIFRALPSHISSLYI